MRIDDLDQGRCISGMDNRILATLKAFGFECDGPVSYQTGHLDAYREALEFWQWAPTAWKPALMPMALAHD